MAVIHDRIDEREARLNLQAAESGAFGQPVVTKGLEYWDCHNVGWGVEVPGPNVRWLAQWALLRANPRLWPTIPRARAKTCRLTGRVYKWPGDVLDRENREQGER